MQRIRSSDDLHPRVATYPFVTRAAQELDDAYRTCLCWPFSKLGVRPTLPTDPWFEPTILDHYRVVVAEADDDDAADPLRRAHHQRQKQRGSPPQQPSRPPPSKKKKLARPLTAAQADVIIDAIEEASPRVQPSRKTLAWWLAGTADAWGCGRWPRGEARDGFRVVRKVAVNLRTGRVLVTVWPEHQDAVDVAMRTLARASLKGGLRTLVMDRSNSGRDVHLVEAVPVDADMLDKRLPNGHRIPIAKVICGPRDDAKDNAADDADDDDEAPPDDDDNEAPDDGPTADREETPPEASPDGGASSSPQEEEEVVLGGGDD